MEKNGGVDFWFRHESPLVNKRLLIKVSRMPRQIRMSSDCGRMIKLSYFGFKICKKDWFGSNFSHKNASLKDAVLSTKIKIPLEKSRTIYWRVLLRIKESTCRPKCILYSGLLEQSEIQRTAQDLWAWDHLTKHVFVQYWADFIQQHFTSTNGNKLYHWFILQ